MKRDFIYYKKGLLYTIATIIVTYALILYIDFASDNRASRHSEFWLTWFGLYLILIGSALTSVIFWEFKTGAGRSQYLSLPASNIEKYISRWFYSLVGYTVLISIIFALFYFLVPISRPTNGWGQEGKQVVKYLILGYVVAHSVMMMYAIWFNKYSAPKGILVSNLLSIGFFAFCFIVFRIVFNELFSGFFRPQHNVMLDNHDGFENMMENRILPILKFCLWVVVPIFFWIVGYFKMSEKEA